MLKSVPGRTWLNAPLAMLIDRARPIARIEKAATISISVKPCWRRREMKGMRPMTAGSGMSSRFNAKESAVAGFAGIEQAHLAGQPLHRDLPARLATDQRHAAATGGTIGIEADLPLTITQQLRLRGEQFHLHATGQLHRILFRHPVAALFDVEGQRALFVVNDGLATRVAQRR